MKVLELFGGIGACSKALERLGIDYEIADYVEIDKYAVMSFNAMHNTNFEPQDVTTWDKDIEVDLIMHGSPCQDFSLAGNQAGGDEGSGTRSSLMYETIRIVEKLKPKYVIWENVKNVVSKKHKHNFDKYCNRMSELGYRNYAQILNAKDYGIPQNRERVFTISIRKDLNKTFEFPQKQELKLKLKDMLEDNVDGKYYLSDKQLESLENGSYNASKPSVKLEITDKGLCQTLDTMSGGNRQPLVRVNDKYYLSNKMIDYITSKNDKYKVNENKLVINRDVACSKTTREGWTRADTSDYICNELPDNYNLIQIGQIYGTEKEPNPQDGRIYDTNGLTPTLDTQHIPKMLIKNNTKQGYLEATDGDGINISSRMKYQRGNVQKDMIQTLDTQCDRGVVENMRIRKLTPKECWRLMGFDDEDFDKASQVCSNTQLYKQAGNSIVVNVLEEILRNLL